MAVRQCKGDGQGKLVIPSDANRDLGFFLVFLGAVGTLPAQYLCDWLGYDASYAFYAGMSGLLCILVGLYLLGFSKKTFRISTAEISVQEGLFGGAVTYRWDSKPVIRLRSQEEERGTKSQEYWLVNLIDGKKQYVLDRRLGNQMESRCLAEAIAKYIQCPVMEKADHGEVTIPFEELDLPFAERVRRNENLLGPKVDKPSETTIEHRKEGQSLIFSWPLASSGMVSEFLTISILVALFSVVPIFSGEKNPDNPLAEPPRFHRSYLDLAREEQKYSFFIIAGGALAAAYVFIFGYRLRLQADPNKLSAHATLWGFPLSSRTIPSQQLEEVWVRQSSRGTYLQFISDEQIISGRTSSLETATWLASQIRHYYGASQTVGGNS